ncbi:hypothetical protein [Corynebacterium flavescens]|uniref:hypothetical protein n=1 Tax=Corynebacterium flavescens TaxID=28028 RepID=UPI00289EC94E|nr:hypothetical protein [Corynebacterium flavescens]
MRHEPHNGRKTVRAYAQRIFTVVTAAALSISVSSADALAQADQIDLGTQIANEQQAREYAVEMVSTNFPASQTAAEAVLRGGADELATYATSGMDEARAQDLRQIVVTISSLSGENVQNAATEVLNAGDIESLSNFIDSGWQTAQIEDDRATAWKASQSPEGSVLKSAADKALSADTEDALSEFASTGSDKARRDDKRREVYELTRSPLPSVAAGASDALMTDTDTAIESYLRYGQFVDAAQDSEKMSITELVDTAISESDKAQQAAGFAATNADQARRATEAARQATQKAKDEALAADAAQVRAGNAASAAGKLANQSAQAADNAVAAAAEARQALAQTADALARAASAASRARIAAQEAASRASAAGYDASMASQARQAAEQARDAARAADNAAQSFVHADAAAGFARNASGAAASAAGNADAAAAAASEAAAAAGAGDAAAAEARAGAARARSAASRARAASNEVDGLVSQITGLVEQARTAAREAADHANKSAQAAEDAAREAGNASAAAQRAGANAQSAQDAAQKSIEAIDLASEIAELAKQAADQHQEQEAQYLKDQAVYSRELEDVKDKVTRADKEENSRLLADLTELAMVASTPDSTLDIGRIQQLTVSAAQVGDAMVQGGAKVALQTGKQEDLETFVQSFEDLKYQDNVNKAQFLWQADPNPEIRTAADEHIEDPPAELDVFLNETVPGMKVPDLTQHAWRLRDAGGPTVQQQADAAISAGNFDALNAFVVEGGFEKARYEDQMRQAYELARTGGPELKASAEAAVLGDRTMLNEFVTIEAFRKSGDDAERAVHTDNIDALLQQGFTAAQKASESAAKAQQSYFTAYGDSVKAANYAQEAAQWSGKAAQSAEIAQSHVRSAEDSLQFALEQQQRAHAAANQAEADAQQANTNADSATSYAMQAHQSANEAASSAAAARQSANAAGYDAQRAGQAAQDAYDAAIQKQLSEQAELQEASMAGAGENSPTSVLDAIKDTIGKEALDILLDLVGITDVINCFKGEISGCLWTALNFIPGGAIAKFGKAAKALPAIRKLLAKLPDVKKLLAVRREEKANGLIASLDKPGTCGISLARAHQTTTYSFAVHRPSPNQARARIQPAVSRCGGYPATFEVYQLNIHTLTADELNVFMKWDRKSSLSEMKAADITSFGYETNEKNVAAAIVSLQDKIAKSVVQVPVTQPHILNSIQAKMAPKALNFRKRNVGQTAAQNQFAQMQAVLAAKKGALAVRLNQRDADFVFDSELGKEVLKTTSRGRPDVNIIDSFGRSIKTEFDRPPASRALHHARQQLDANPDADVWLLTLDDIDESDELMKVIKANREAVDNYTPELGRV